MLTATATSGLPVTYTVVGPATLVGNQLTATGPGTVTVNAYQQGNDSWLAAERVTQTITVTGPTPRELFDTAMTGAGLTGDDASPDAIPYNDGIPNLLKYAFNMDFTGPDSHAMTSGGTSGLPAGEVVEIEGQNYWRVEFVRRTGSGLVYTPKKSATLQQGSFVPLSAEPTSEGIDSEWTRLIYLEPVDLTTTRYRPASSAKMAGGSSVEELDLR